MKFSKIFYDYKRSFFAKLPSGSFCTAQYRRSSDALLDGQLGQLVNPDSIDEIAAAIQNVLTDKKSFSPNRALLMQRFSYEAYKEKLDKLIPAAQRQPRQLND